MVRCRAIYLTPLLRNHARMSRIVTLAYNEAIMLHLLCVVALTCVCVLGEIDHLAGLAGLRVGLSLLALAKCIVINHLFQVVMGPGDAAAPSPDGGDQSCQSGETIRLNRSRQCPRPSHTPQRRPRPVRGEAGYQGSSILSSWVCSCFSMVCHHGFSVLSSWDCQYLTLPEATAAAVPPCRGSTPGEPFHDTGQSNAGGSSSNSPCRPILRQVPTAQALMPCLRHMVVAMVVVAMVVVVAVAMAHVPIMPASPRTTITRIVPS